MLITGVSTFWAGTANNLHFLNYWELLKQKTAVENVDITSLDDEIEYSGNNFVDNIKKRDKVILSAIKTGIILWGRDLFLEAIKNEQNR